MLIFTFIRKNCLRVVTLSPTFCMPQISRRKIQEAPSHSLAYREGWHSLNGACSSS